MGDSDKTYEEQIKHLEEARDQLSGGWLQTEREKVRILASINNLEVGYMMVDDQLKILHKNPAVEKVLGLSQVGEWTVNEIHEAVSVFFDLIGACDQVIKTRKSVSAKNIPFSGNNINFFISPILILKESITCFGATILIEPAEAGSNKRETLADRLTAIFGPRIESRLRNVATAINSLLADGADSKNADSILDKTKKSIEYLQSDIDDLMSGSEDLVTSMVKREGFDIGAVISQTIAEFQPFADSKSLKLEFENLERGFLNALGDRILVKQILYNYLSNAITYTNAGNIRVSMEDQKGFLKVSVADTGAGVAEENVKLLFSKFPQVNGQYGTGLYHSRLLAELMGGKAYLERTEISRGSTFAFTVPVATGVNAGALPAPA